MDKKWGFILVRGVLGWGSGMFAAVSLLPALMRRSSTPGLELLPQFLVWALAGALFGYALWHYAMKQNVRPHPAVEKERPGSSVTPYRTPV